jgi:glutamate-1-semialdehyde 2,1-aminomutase
MTTVSAAGSRMATLVERAERLFPGGVNSPVRAFRAVGRPPLVLERGDGPHVWDADGRRYIDYIGAWGPAILGHAHPAVIAVTPCRRSSASGSPRRVPRR